MLSLMVIIRGCRMRPLRTWVREACLSFTFECPSLDIEVRRMAESHRVFVEIGWLVRPRKQCNAPLELLFAKFFEWFGVLLSGRFFYHRSLLNCFRLFERVETITCVIKDCSFGFILRFRSDPLWLVIRQASVGVFFVNRIETIELLGFYKRQRADNDAASTAL